MAFGISDIRQTWRALALQPGNSLFTILVLALGLAGVIGMLSILKSMVWDPLPFPNAAQVQTVGWRDLANSGSNLRALDADQFLDWQDRFKGKAELAGVGQATVNLGTDEGVERLEGAFVTHNLFPMLGVTPVLGRNFSLEDDQPGAPPVVILSNQVWRTRFASNTAIIGTQVRANAEPATVVGVMPPDFSFPLRETVWLPAQVVRAPTAPPDRELKAFARTLDSDTPVTIHTILESWLADQITVDAARWSGVEVDAEPMAMLYADRETRMLLNLMLACVALVLLVACANAANLMLVRTMARSRDLALRLTLGASRSRVGFYLLGQSLTLTLVATAIALPLAHWGVDWVINSYAGTDDGPPPWVTASLEPSLTAVALLIALITAAIVAVLPVLRLRVNALGASLRDGGRAVSGGGLGKLSRVLVAGQLAMTCVVLLATLVIVRGVDSLSKTDLGINPDHLLTARIALFPQLYPEDAETVGFFERLTTTLREQPEVLSVGAGTSLPGLTAGTERVLAEGHESAHDKGQVARYAAVDSGFVPTYGIDLHAGRNFDTRDTTESDPVVIVDDRFAENLFAGADPIGRRVRIPAEGEDARWHTVIGVVENLQLEDPGDPALPNVLVSLTQSPARFVSVVMRTRANPEAFKTRFLELLRQQDPDTPAYWLRTYDEVMRVAMVGERVVSGMFSAFGLVALVLSAAGLYGLIAQLVSQRTREIGVQRALGAPNASVLRRLLSQTMGQVLVGLVVGVALAIPFADKLSNTLTDLPTDNWGVPILVLMLITVSIAATLLPARRALAVDPTVALRDE